MYGWWWAFSKLLCFDMLFCALCVCMVSRFDLIVSDVVGQCQSLWFRLWVTVCFLTLGGCVCVVNCVGSRVLFV